MIGGRPPGYSTGNIEEIRESRVEENLEKLNRNKKGKNKTLLSNLNFLKQRKIEYFK